MMSVMEFIIQYLELSRIITESSFEMPVREFSLPSKYSFFSQLDDDEHQWIIRTCRKGWDEHVGGQNPRLKPDMSKLKN